MTRVKIKAGDRFGKLTAISSISINNRLSWNCRCDCGKEILVRSDSLRQGKTSCGCEMSSLRAGDITGKKFGLLTVIEKAGKNERGKTLWRCRCECGNEKITHTHALTHGIVKSCGCLKNSLINLEGETFGELKVESFAGLNESKSALWNCRCSCGNMVVRRGYELTCGHSKSCGCKQYARDREDLTDQVFGKLTAIRPTGNVKNNLMIWECRCECGNIICVQSSSLKAGHSRSCGCLQKEASSNHMKNYKESMKGVIYVENTDVSQLIPRKTKRNNTSGITGVYWHAAMQKWCAAITFKGVKYYLGSYEDKNAAAKARQNAEDHLFGDFLEYYKETYPQNWPEIEKRIMRAEARRNSDESSEDSM